MYQLKDGKVINQLLHPDHIPDGWHDSPKAANAATEIVPKKKPGRPKKVTNDDSTGHHNQLGQTGGHIS